MRKLFSESESKKGYLQNGQRTNFGFDAKLLIATVILTVFGLIIVYDASSVQAFADFADKYYYIRQQLIWMVLGFICLTIFTFFDYHLLKKSAVPFFISSLLLLILVIIPGFGVSAGGAHRWLKLSFITIQPAEIVKLSSVIFFAALFERKRGVAAFLISIASISLIVGGLQKDLGSTIVFLLTSMGMFLVAGAPLRYFFGMIPPAIIGGLFLILGSSYRKNRILAFLDPFSDPQGFTYHISQILIALGSGGLLGLGLGQSRQKFAYIPEVTTDSIFSIIGEELGFLGSVILVGVFCFFIYQAFVIVENADDLFGKYLAIGITLWLATQTVINLAAMVSLIPLTGVPLPFISYGGSALLTNLIGVGILLNISRKGKSLR